MAETLSKCGLYLDEIDKLCILEPEVYKQTNSLKDESKTYLGKIEEFRRITSDFLSLVEKLAVKVEKEKMRAIGAHNMLQTMEKHKETNQQELRALVAEKTTEHERLKVQYSSLQKTEMEQNEIISRLTKYQ